MLPERGFAMSRVLVAVAPRFAEAQTPVLAVEGPAAVHVAAAIARTEVRGWKGLEEKTRSLLSFPVEVVLRPMLAEAWQKAGWENSREIRGTLEPAAVAELLILPFQTGYSTTAPG